MKLAEFVRSLPIRHKLNAIILATCTVVLFLVSGSFVTYEAYRFRQDLLDQYSTLASVLATNSAAAIVFDDQEAGVETLSALRNDSHVVHASLSSGEGGLFAEYLRDERSAVKKDRWAVEHGHESWEAYLLHHHAVQDPYHLRSDHLDIFVPVILDGDTIGKLFLQVDLLRLYSSLRGYTLIAGGVLLASLVLALLLSQKLQRIISQPILLLAERMRHVSAEQDYAVRVRKQSEDEIGLVFDGFNDMLAQIERRDQTLTQLAAAVQQAPDGIAILDLGGRIHQTNQAFLRLTRCDLDQVQGLECGSLYPVLLGTSSWAQVFDQARQGTPWSGRAKARRLDGEEYDEFCSVAPITDEQGQVVNVLLLKRDITRELQMEVRVRESQKLQALGTLAGGIAHDFNNLMSPIVGYSELLMKRAAPGSKEHMRLERISEAAVEASELVKQILAFSRPGAESRQALSLQTLVKECLKLFHMALPPNIQVESEFAADIPPIAADPSQAHQVLMNLLTNAKHAMKDRGGQLLCRVDVCTPTREEVTEFPSVAGTRCVRLTVQDEGHGMSADVRDRIFEPFFSTKGLGEGTGMGLAVVRGVVEDHDGAITVDSELGRGSIFRVYLPVAPPSESGTISQELQGPVEGNENILFLEEDESIREPLCEAIALLGYRVNGVPSDTDLLEELSSAERTYDALIVDEQHIGSSNGDSLIGRVRQLAPGLPILVCAGYLEQNDRDELAEEGIRAIVEKPISPIAIGTALRQIYPPLLEPEEVEPI